MKRSLGSLFRSALVAATVVLILSGCQRSFETPPAPSARPRGSA